MTRTAVSVLVVVLFSSAGCTMRHRLDSPFPPTLPPDQHVEFWRRGQRIVLRQVSIDSGVVRGAVGPWRPYCDSCRVAMPRADADSLVLVNTEGGWFAGGAVALVAGWLYLFHCWPSRACLD